MRRALMRIDRWVFGYVHLRLARRWLDGVMRVYTHLGGFVATVGTAVLLLVLGGETRRAGMASLLALAGSQLVVQVLKRRTERPRPYLVLAESRSVVAPLADYSFPSGHTAASFALATVLGAFWPSWAGVALGAAALVGLSRTYLGHHYPSDVLVGALIGMGFAYLSLLHFGVPVSVVSRLTQA
ncbi:MAG TPA: phosphatase PAP2 family protein [Limnochordales bacterium]